MTRTSKVLKRLGVAGLAAVTIGAGLPALLAAGAQAAGPVNSVTITPGSQSGAAGTCLNYTVNAKDAAGVNVSGATITVTVSDTTTAAQSPVATQDIRFCAAGNAVPGTPVSGTSGAGGTDTARFSTDANGNVVFGIVADQPGGANIRAFNDVNGNNTLDATEASGVATATFTAGGPAGSTAAANAVTQMTASPTSDIAIVGETRTFAITLKNGANDTVAGVTPSYVIATGSPNAQGPANCGQSDNSGVALCKIAFTKTGTNETITFFVNQTNHAITSAGLDPGEPSTTATVTTNPAPSTAFVVRLTCNADNSLANQNNPQATDVATGGADNCVNDTRDPSRTFTATVYQSSAANAAVVTTGVALSFGVTGGGTDATVSPTEATTNASGQVVVTVTDPTVTSGEVLTLTATIRGTGNNDTATLTYVNAPFDARNIALSPKTQTVAPGSATTVSATVTDVDGKPVKGVTVTFSESGPGAFRSGNTAVTNAAGVATIEVVSLSTESGTETITGDITGNGTSQCSAKAGQNAAGGTLTGTQAGAKAGNCTDTATVTYGAASPSPTAGGTARPTLSTSTPDIQPNIQGIYTATGASPNSVLELRCYTRPSTTYFTARSTTVNAAGGPVEFRILPGANTRCYARPAGNDALASNSVVINVHTTLSLSTVRTGVRTYIFQGRNLPRRAGQLITLYRVNAAGQEIRTSNLVTDASGIYRVTRKFTGTGTFRFKVRTSQTLNNAAGVSNTITVTVH